MYVSYRNQLGISLRPHRTNIKCHSTSMILIQQFSWIPGELSDTEKDLNQIEYTIHTKDTAQDANP